MLKPTPESPRDLRSLDLRSATQAELDRLKHMSDDDLLRASTTLDLFSIAESMRRLKNALRTEEKAIKWLTIVLVVLTVVLVCLGLEALRR